MTDRYAVYRRRRNGKWKTSRAGYSTRKFAEEVAQCLADQGCVVRVVNLLSGDMGPIIDPYAEGRPTGARGPTTAFFALARVR